MADVKQTFDQTSEQARETAARAASAGKTVNRAGYAAIGLADSAVGFVRKSGDEFPERIKRAPQGLSEFAASARRHVATGFEELAARGRQVTGQIASDSDVEAADARVVATKRQFKAAATSVGRTTQAQAEAVGSAGKQVGKDRAPGATTSARRSTAKESSS